MSRILIVENDAGRSYLLHRLLCAEGFVSTRVRGLAEAMVAIAGGEFNGLFLTDSPPSMDGLACCLAIRKVSHIPLILLSSNVGACHKVRCLGAGADDYIVRPYNARELVARLRAILRGRSEYSTRPARTPIAIGDVKVDTALGEVSRLGLRLRLTGREYSLVRCLAEHAGEAVPRDVLFEEVWGYDASLGGKLLEVTVHRVRLKMESDPRRPAYLRTVRGVGYRLGPPGND